VQRFTEAMRAVKVGNGLESGVGLGPLINAAAVNSVQELVDETVGAGARVLTGGRRPDGRGCFYPPTVLDRVPRTARILTQEIFGPVAPIVEFDDEDQAVELANDTEYGLVSYLYTSDLRRGLRVAERLEAGMVGLNRGVVSDPAAPFGGVKQSGLGREGSHDGLLEFLEKKYVALDW
jgi:succinate-semialdehyde dehydrogenase / glutarate-semialdehyde dehydrogenase